MWSSSPRDRRRSATRCWTHRSPWRPGCWTTTPTATTRSPAPSSADPPSGNLTRDHILDNITHYWLTGTGVLAARSYWESARAQAAAAGQTPPPVTIPLAFSAFPGEIFQAPRSWFQLGYPTLTYYNQPVRGGHFAAWEEPQLFTEELWAAFRSLR